jgi:hypothetical protein
MVHNKHANKFVFQSSRLWLREDWQAARDISEKPETSLLASNLGSSRNQFPPKYWEQSTRLYDKLSLCLTKDHVMETYGECRCNSIILHLGTSWRWVGSLVPRPLYPSGKGLR